MKQHIKNGILFFSALVMISLAACKKEEKNDSNIDDFSYNKIITNAAIPGYTVDSVDVNKDGKFDLYIATYRIHADSQYVIFEGNDAAIAINDAAQFEGMHLVKTFSKNQIPPVYNEITENYKTHEVFSLDIGAASFGFAGDGDTFLGFGMKKNDTDDIYYGWLRVNIPADYSSIKIIDGALNSVANTPIPCGSK